MPLKQNSAFVLPLLFVLIFPMIVNAEESTGFETATVARMEASSPAELQQKLSGETVLTVSHATYARMNESLVNLEFQWISNLLRDSFAIAKAWIFTTQTNYSSLENFSWNDFSQTTSNMKQNELLVLSAPGKIENATVKIQANTIIDNPNAWASSVMAKKPVLLLNSEFSGLSLPNNLTNAFLDGLSSNSTIVAPTATKDETFVRAFVCSMLSNPTTIGEAYRNARNNYYNYSDSPSGLALMSYEFYGSPEQTMLVTADSAQEYYCGNFGEKTGLDVKITINNQPGQEFELLSGTRVWIGATCNVSGQYGQITKAEYYRQKLAEKPELFKTVQNPCEGSVEDSKALEEETTYFITITTDNGTIFTTNFTTVKPMLNVPGNMKAILQPGIAWQGKMIVPQTTADVKIVMASDSNEQLTLEATNPNGQKFTSNTSTLAALTLTKPVSGNWAIKVSGSNAKPTSFSLKTEKIPVNLPINTRLLGINLSSIYLDSLDASDPNGITLVFSGKQARAGEQVVDANAEVEKLKKWFLTALVIPDSEQFVNLPLGDVIIDEQLAQTDAGRVLLDEDIALKKAALDNERSTLENIYSKWEQLLEQSPYNSELKEKGYYNSYFYPSWVMCQYVRPGEIKAQAKQNKIYIEDSTLKSQFCWFTHPYIMELSKFNLTSNATLDIEQRLQTWTTYFKQTMETQHIPIQDIVVNNDKNFADLRSLARVIAIAQWFKQNTNNQEFKRIIDSKDITGLEASTPFNREFYKDQTDNFLYNFNPPLHGGIQQWYVYGGMVFQNTEPTSITDLSESKEAQLQQATEENYVNENGVIYFGEKKQALIAKLVPESIWLTNNAPTANENVTITVSVLNEGTADSNSFNVKFFDEFESSSEAKTSTLFYETTVNPLNAGESTTITATWNTETKIGKHTIKASINDGNEITAIAEVISPYPIAKIVSPENGAAFTQGYKTILKGTGFDYQDGVLPDLALTWSSSKDGTIGTGQTIETSTLSAGNHVITLTVRDSTGFEAISQIAIAVNPRYPKATMVYPVEGSVFKQGEKINLMGFGFDSLDGIIPNNSISWKSNIDGLLGTGNSLEASNLSANTHTITMEATNSAGNKETKTANIIVVGYENKLVHELSDGKTTKLLDFQSPGQQTVFVKLPSDANIQLAKLDANGITDEYSYSESFSSTAFKDNTITTGDWNTVSKSAKLGARGTYYESFPGASGFWMNTEFNFVPEDDITIDGIYLELYAGDNVAANCNVKLFEGSGYESDPTYLRISSDISVKDRKDYYFPFTRVDLKKGHWYWFRFGRCGYVFWLSPGYPIPNHQRFRECYDYGWSILCDGYAGSSLQDTLAHKIVTTDNYYYHQQIIQSTNINSSGKGVISATLNADDSLPLGTSISYELSADGGAHWQSAQKNTKVTFTNTGTDLRWKATLYTDNGKLTPEIKSVNISYNASGVSNPSLNIGNDDSIEWNFAGFLAGRLTLPDFKDPLNNYVWTHYPEEDGNVLNPLVFSSQSNGKLEISNINIQYRALKDFNFSYPDLLVEKIVFENDPVDSNIASISVVVANAGDMNASNFNVALLVDGTTAETKNLSIPAQQEKTVSFSWNASYGEHTIQAKADSTNTIKEQSETNNDLSGKIFVPDTTPPEAPEPVTSQTQQAMKATRSFGAQSTSSSTQYIYWSPVQDARGIVEYEYSVDLGDWKSNGQSTSLSVPLDGEGIHSIAVRAKDSTGYLSFDGNTNILLDTEPPTTPILKPLTAQWSKNTKTLLEWSQASDSGSGISHYILNIDNSQTIQTEQTELTQEFSNGAHTIKVKAVDKAGFESNWSNEIQVLVDLQGPTAPTVSSTSDFLENIPVFSWNTPTDDSGVAGYYYVVDQSPETNPDYTARYTVNNTVVSPIPLTKGAWYFHIKAIDNVGNLGQTTHYKIDIANEFLPLKIISPNEGTYQNGPITVNFSLIEVFPEKESEISLYYSQKQGNFESLITSINPKTHGNCTKRQSPYATEYNCSYELNTSNVAAGSYFIDANAHNGFLQFIDSSDSNIFIGKTNQPPKIDSFTPDTNKTINEGETITFSITYSDPDNDQLTTEWHLDGSLISKDTSTFNYVTDFNSSGMHEISVTVSDGKKQATHSWTITVLDVNIACNNNSDCGTNGFINDNFCLQNSITRTYRTFACLNPSTPNAQCTQTDENQAIMDCLANQTCNQGQCLNIACTANIDCGADGFTGEKYCKDNSVYQQYKTYSCNNSGTENSSCSSTEEERLIESCSYSCSNGACQQNPGLSLNCPAEPISDSYSFTWNKGNYTSSAIQFSYTQTFNSKTYFSVSTKTATSYNIKPKYSTLISYEKKAVDGQLYARIQGKDTKGKTVYSNTCTFTLKQQIASALDCPIQTIDKNYTFNWTKENSASFTIYFSYNQNFSSNTYLKISTASTNKYNIKKYYTTLLGYKKKTADGQLYTKVQAKDAYNRTTNSNTCTFTIE